MNKSRQIASITPPNAKKQSYEDLLKEAERAGAHAASRGPTTKNCAPVYFGTPELIDAWRRGYNKNGGI